MNRSSVYLVTVFILSAVFCLASHGTAYSYELFTVGEYGASYHYNGKVWRRITDKDITEDLRGVWAYAPDNVYAVGEEGGIYNYDGHDWSEIARPTDRLNDIWGSSENNIFAAGNDVYHYDGVSWNLFLEAYVVDIWGTSSANVYFAGDGEVYQFNGGEVNPVGPPLGDSQYILGIWASDENNVFLATYNRYYYDEVWGYLCHKNFHYYDGFDWTGGFCDCDMEWPACYHFEGGIWGADPDNVWATGGGYLCDYDGECWDMINSNASGTDLWGAAPDDVYFCTYNSGIVHYDGVSFTHVLPEDDYGLFDLTLYAICGLGTSLTPAEVPKPGQSLSQNHPNPFNPTTTISFSLRAKGVVSLSVYDVDGRLVDVLIDGVMDAGPHEVTWDGKDNAGRGVASGVYFYRLQAGEFTETRKMVLLR